MEDNYSYSFIIPHKNRPELLQRAIGSIPHREDVQIIIVDDNSDPSLVDFDHFPGLNDSHVKVLFTKEGKGAGYARNAGLTIAKGRWLVFLDSDDYYLDNLETMMNLYVDSSSDMIVFKQMRIDPEGKAITCGYDELFDRVIKTRNNDELIYEYFCPIARFVKRKFVVDNNILFQEVRFSNDVLFMLKAGVLANEIIIDNHAIYCVCETNNSLVRNKNWQNPYTRTLVSIDAYKYLKEKGLKKGMRCTANKCFSWWQNTFYINKTASLRLLPKLVACMGLRFFINFPSWLSSKI